MFDLATQLAKCDRYPEAARLLSAAIDRPTAAQPSVEHLKNCLADTLKSQGLEVDAVEVYQVG